MLVEPPRTRVSDRPRPPLTTEPRAARLRVRVRDPGTPAPEADPPAAPPPPSARSVSDASRSVPLTQVVLLAAALALAATSRGDVVVLTLLLGFGARRRASALAAGGALGAALLRWGSGGLGAIAGAQAVLGPAGWTGSAAAVASSWFGAMALVLAAVSLDRSSALVTTLSVAPFAIAAADVVVGPAPGGGLALRVAASAIALVATTALARWRSLPWVAVGCGALALVCAGLAR